MSELTIHRLSELVLADYEVTGKHTRRRVEESYRLHLIPFFHETPAACMGARTAAYIQHRLNESAAPATIRQELMNLGRGLTLAVQAGLLEYRPAITTPRVRNVRTSVIPEEKVDSVLAYLPPDERDLVLTAYLTGWRKGELLALKWRNVDRRECVIRLDRGTTKNGEGRVFPYGTLPDLARLIERRWLKTAEAEKATGMKVAHVFHRNGKPIRLFRRSWRTACERAGLGGQLFHDIRRSAAQNMVRAGVPIQTAMALLGHKTRSIFDRYAIVQEDDLRAGVAQLAARIMVKATERPRPEDALKPFRGARRTRP